MSKKATISIVFTLIVAMLTTSLVLAAVPSATAMSRQGIRIGIITSVSRDEIVLKNTAGKEKTILLSSSTKYMKINGDEKDWKDLANGTWIIAVGTINENRELAASTIVISPRKINMGAWIAPRQSSRVASVELKANAFRLFANKGFTTYHVNSSTRYFGKVKTLRDLKAGMEVIVSFTRGTGGVLTARSILGLP